MPICLLSLEHIPTAVIQAPENFPTWKGMVVNLIHKDFYLGSLNFSILPPCHLVYLIEIPQMGLSQTSVVLLRKFWGNVFSQNK